jgi:COMPASS component SWD2
VLTAGTKSNDVLYWALHDHKTLRKFRGHAGTVVDLSMCPVDDLFLTSSKDGTIGLWDLKNAGCVARLDLPKETEGTPHAVFDSTGMVFAAMAGMAGGHGHYVHLYDARNYTGGAFAELKVYTKDLQDAMTTHRVTPPAPTNPPSLLSFKTIEFNQSGNQILLQAEEGVAVVLDGYDGTIQRIFQSSRGGKGTSACFTPDDKTVLMGTETGMIDCWDVVSGRVVRTLEGHMGPVGAVIANPKYSQIASSCTNTCLWIW